MHTIDTVKFAMFIAYIQGTFTSTSVIPKVTEEEVKEILTKLEDMIVVEDMLVVTDILEPKTSAPTHNFINSVLMSDKVDHFLSLFCRRDLGAQQRQEILKALQTITGASWKDTKRLLNKHFNYPSDRDGAEE